MTERGRKPGLDLEALKKALAEKEAAARKPAAAQGKPPRSAPRTPARPQAPAVPPASPPPPQPPPPPLPERPVSFDEEMTRLGVGRAPGGPERLLAPPPSAARLAAPNPAEPELPAELDDDALWALSTKGVTAPGQGVSRSSPKRSEALPTLDLHGFAEEDAVSELRRFVQLHRGAEPRWVRVITGRGTHGPGVVRRAAVGWLQANSSIAAFRPAPPEQGGAGVLLVQLTRKAR